MKNKHCLLLVLIVLSIFTQYNLYAQANQYFNKLQQVLSNRNNTEQKISTDLFCRLFNYNNDVAAKKSVMEAISIFDKKFYRTDDKNRIFINIRLNTTDQNQGKIISQKINELGGKIHSINPGHNNFVEVKCWISLNMINEVAHLSLVEFIRTPAPTHFRTVTTAGDAQLKAADARSQMNLSGAGFKIGVISGGVKSISSIPSNELGPVTVLNQGDVNDDEGTAMLEIIHDVAPAAELFLPVMVQKNHDGSYNENAMCLPAKYR